MIFPKNFYWGTSTSAYQVEGGIKNDWSAIGGKYNAGKACDHYNKYEQDFDLAKNMNNNAHRFSIEWARIEPEQGKFDKKEIEHYKKVIDSLKKRGLEPFVTLYHWTLPNWFVEKGGWLNKESVKYFTRYVEFVVKNLDVKFWVVLNEPNVYAPKCFLTGEWPPFKKSIFKYLKVSNRLSDSYKKSYKIIHKINPKAIVGISQLTNYFEPAHKWFLPEVLIAKIFWFIYNDYFCYKIKKHIDYFGFSYYFHDRIVWYPPFRKNLNKEVTDLGWEIYPKGIYFVLKNVKKYKKPIYITENGLADADDSRRKDFIINHLKYVNKAIEDGIDVRGYFHWSLLDNYEWARDGGYGPRFGLIEMNYKTMERIPRDSSLIYAKICKNNSL